jgi:hypothetical protein
MVAVPVDKHNSQNSRSSVATGRGIMRLCTRQLAVMKVVNAAADCKMHCRQLMWLQHCWIVRLALPADDEAYSKGEMRKQRSQCTLKV